MYLEPTHMLVGYPVLTKRTAEQLKTTPVRRLPFFSFVYILDRGKAASWLAPLGKRRSSTAFVMTSANG